jgi:hypothetical protein
MVPFKSAPPQNARVGAVALSSHIRFPVQHAPALVSRLLARPSKETKPKMPIMFTDVCQIPHGLLRCPQCWTRPPV